MVKIKTISQLRKQADKLFSQAVRMRDADNFGQAECITCRRIGHWKEFHAGHFQSRRFPATRWSDENVNAQCVSCNTFNGGEQYKYSIAIDKKYGNGTAKRLHQEAQAYFKVTRPFLEQIIHDAKEQIKFYEENYRHNPYRKA